jgi:hypothetical protein
MSDWQVQSFADEDGKKFPGHVADLPTWIGLQFVNKQSAVRVKNLGAANGTTMNDDLAFESLARIPSGGRLSYRIMNRGSLEQPRKSRTNVTSATGVPTTPESVAGIPIVITASLVNMEA